MEGNRDIRDVSIRDKLMFVNSFVWIAPKFFTPVLVPVQFPLCIIHDPTWSSL